VFPYEGPGSSNSFFSKTYYIKRIIGLPGETVYIDYDGNIFINGVKLDEHYGLARISNPGIAAEPLTLGEDEYFVMGDNRNDSMDSRYEDVGNIKRDELVGKAWLRIYPFDSFGTVK
jgi:signal peptidase I